MNAGVGCHTLLQGIFLTLGWNSRFLPLLHWQVGSLPIAPPTALLIFDSPEKGEHVFGERKRTARAGNLESGFR